MSFGDIKGFIKKISKIFSGNALIMKPNFLIPGAGRSGTTCIYYYLKQHPEIYLSEKKEPNYFSEYYYFGEALYLSNFKLSKEYRAIGEASTRYLTHLEVPKRIHDFNPNFKLIFILRNPIERSFSHYKRDIQFFGEKRLFEQIIENSDKYLWQGKYFTHISRFLRYFSKKNLFILIFEKFIKEPEKYLKEVCEFLEVNPNFKFNLKKIEKNQSKMPISLSLQKINDRFFKTNPMELKLIRFVKSGIYSIINSINWNLGLTIFPKMKNITYIYLKKYFSEEIKSLEKLIGIDIIEWN